VFQAFVPAFFPSDARRNAQSLRDTLRFLPGATASLSPHRKNSPSAQTVCDVAEADAPGDGSLAIVPVEVVHSSLLGLLQSGNSPADQQFAIWRKRTRPATEASLLHQSSHDAAKMGVAMQLPFS
jgi:hypothetical protein